MGRGYQRRKLFINHELQGKLIFQVFIVSFCGVALSVSLGGAGVTVGNTPLILAQKLLQAHWLFLLIGGVVVSLLTLLVSHRFAGPLYRFEATFTELAARNLDQLIHLRPKDVGQPLAELVNRFTASYSTDIAELRALNDQLADILRDGKQQPAAVELQRAADLSQQVAALLSKYRCKSGD